MANIKCWLGCGRPGLFSNINGQYRCAKYNSTCPAVKERKKNSCLLKYGVTNPFYIAGIRDKIDNINLTKYGTTDPGNLPAFRAKALSTEKLNFGEGHGLANPIIKDKFTKTLLDKYGVDNPLKNADIRRQVASTNIEKYGYAYTFQCNNIKQKILDTIRERYGVDYATQNADILTKAHAHRSKQMILPSGKIILVQGYEPIVILDLIKSGISEEEIITEKKLIPKIFYKFEGKERRYFPDIFIERYNLIIEVKSLYTWKANKDKNIAKINACKAAGFNIRVAIR
jgi:hypothetical protein